MSVENNSVRSIDGLNRISCDVIDISESIQIDGDNGEPNQIIISDGTDCAWNYVSSLLQNLTLSSPLSFVSGSNYNGTTARQIQISNIPNSDLQNSTISGVALGSNLNAITPSSPLSFDEGGTYNGNAAKPLSITNIPNSDLQNSTISGVSLGGTLANLTGGSGITMTTYTGATARSITLTENEISGVALGGDLANLDTAGYGISMGASYNGNTARSIALSFGAGITADGTGIKLINANTATTLGNTTLTLGATATDLDMGGGDIDDAIITDSNLLDTANKVLPPNVYNNAGQYVMPFDAGMFHPNDDSSYYNYCLDDDGSKTSGRGMIKSTALEVLGVIHIPRGWVATGSFLDVRDSSGNVITSSPPTYDVYKIHNTQTGGTIDSRVHFSGMMGDSINVDNTFSGAQTFTGVFNYSLLIDIHMSSSSHFIGGGYILLNAPS